MVSHFIKRLKRYISLKFYRVNKIYFITGGVTLESKRTSSPFGSTQSGSGNGVGGTTVKLLSVERT